MAVKLEQLPPKLRKQAEQQLSGVGMKQGSGKLTIRVTPMGKPRMTQRDKWKKRPAAERYHAFKDVVREQGGSAIQPKAGKLSWTAYIPIPKSWSKKKKAEMRGAPHQQRPDRDNIDKAILDALFEEDSHIYSGTIEKFWDDGAGARIEFFWA